MAQLNSGLYPTFGNGSGPHEGPYESTGPAQGESDDIGRRLQEAQDLARRLFYQQLADYQAQQKRTFELFCYESINFDYLEACHAERWHTN
jgi:hypothetical protein